MKVWEEKCDFKELLLKDKLISKYLSRQDLDKLFNLDKIMININKIYKRINLK
jgi:adenylosuccinate lyase